MLNQNDNVYFAARWSLKWSKNKIKPGTAFMHKLVSYLKSETIQNKFKINRGDMKVIISDMYEIGEGEKKIVNYINKYLVGNNDNITVYSPDADMILLCMILPINHLFMLRYNKQTSDQNKRDIYDLINIQQLKNNIAYYVNRNIKNDDEKYDIDKINRDIVCISTLFGNDFVPKIETLNVKKGFQNIMDAYLKSLHKSNKSYLIDSIDNGKYKLNFVFLKNIISFLLPEEEDFIKYNHLYGKYITIGQIKNVFSYLNINSENLMAIFNEFKHDYEDLKHHIKNRKNLTNFETSDRFMESLKKSVLVIVDDQCVNTSYLSNKEMLSVLQKYYYKYRDFPRLNINLNTWSHSINDQIHKNYVKSNRLNEYQRKIYQFDKMLDEFYTKFNAQPLSLTSDKIQDYYDTYFGIELFDKNNSLTTNAQTLIQEYLEGMLWVFNYYFNDESYLSKWYYKHERAPLMAHILMFLKNIDQKYFDNIDQDLVKYHVGKLENYFNPLEQLIYVSPMTNDVVELLPNNYKNYILSDDLDPFLKIYFVDIKEIVSNLWTEAISDQIDCHSIVYFNKCLIKSITKPTVEDDKYFFKSN